MRLEHVKKQTALAVSVICLIWIGIMMVPVGHHLMEHGNTTKHSGQHASAACTWMCAASAFSQSSPLVFNDVLLPFIFAIASLQGIRMAYFPVFELRARPPPF